MHIFQLEGEDAGLCSVVVEPFDGVLIPREQVTITVTFTAHTTVSKYNVQ